MFFLKYIIDCSDPLTCFSLTQNVTQDWNNIQHKDQFIDRVVLSLGTGTGLVEFIVLFIRT